VGVAVGVSQIGGVCEIWDSGVVCGENFDQWALKKTGLVVCPEACVVFGGVL